MSGTHCRCRSAEYCSVTRSAIRSMLMLVFPWLPRIAAEWSPISILSWYRVPACEWHENQYRRQLRAGSLGTDSWTDIGLVKFIGRWNSSDDVTTDIGRRWNSSQPIIRPMNFIGSRYRLEGANRYRPVPRNPTLSSWKLYRRPIIGPTIGRMIGPISVGWIFGWIQLKISWIQPKIHPTDDLCPAFRWIFDRLKNQHVRSSTDIGWVSAAYIITQVQIPMIKIAHRN